MSHCIIYPPEDGSRTLGSSKSLRETERGSLLGKGKKGVTVTHTALEWLWLLRLLSNANQSKHNLPVLSGKLESHFLKTLELVPIWQLPLMGPL